MRTALAVIDYQADFVIGSLGSEAAASIEDAISERIEEHLAKGSDLFFTMDTHDAGYLGTEEGLKLRTPHCEERSSGWELYGKVGKYADKGTVVKKTTFGSIELACLLGGMDEIEICGVATNVCVLANAVIIKTSYPETRVLIRRNCVASYDGRLHDEALEIMDSLLIDII